MKKYRFACRLCQFKTGIQTEIASHYRLEHRRGRRSHKSKLPAGARTNSVPVELTAALAYFYRRRKFLDEFIGHMELLNKVLTRLEFR